MTAPITIKTISSIPTETRHHISRKKLEDMCNKYLDDNIFPRRPYNSPNLTIITTNKETSKQSTGYDFITQEFYRQDTRIHDNHIDKWIKTPYELAKLIDEVTHHTDRYASIKYEWKTKEQYKSYKNQLIDARERERKTAIIY